MDNRMRNELDRYITGDYGEREFDNDEPSPMLATIFTLGAVARSKGDSLDSCPYTEPHFAMAWRSGWTDEDMSLHVYEQD